MKPCTRTMYMHTVDGAPATFSQYGEWIGIHPVSRGHAARAATLVDSLRHLRMQQRWVAEREARDTIEYPFLPRSDPKRFGYVLVRVPVTA